VQFDLADGLNCIIGARGTGKTTALELVRYAIDALPSREASPAEHKRIESLIQQNLAGGRVEVRVETKDGLQYTITRSWGEEPIVLTADGQATAIALAGSGIFKADIFSQNEVEGIADRASSQLALVDNFESEAISQIETDVKQVLSMLAANAGRIVPLRDKLAALGDELSTLPSVEQKLKRFSPSENKVACEVDRAHAQKSLRDRERRAVDRAGEILHATARGLAGLVGQIRRGASGLMSADIDQGPNAAMIRDIVQGLVECGREVDQLLEQAQSRIAGQREEQAQQATAVATIHKEQELAFRSVIERYEQAQGEAAERTQLERLRNTSWPGFQNSAIGVLRSARTLSVESTKPWRLPSG